MKVNARRLPTWQDILDANERRQFRDRFLSLVRDLACSDEDYGRGRITLLDLERKVAKLVI